MDRLCGMGSGKTQQWFTGDYYPANLKTNSLGKWEEALADAGHISRDFKTRTGTERQQTEDRAQTLCAPPSSLLGS